MASTAAMSLSNVAERLELAANSSILNSLSAFPVDRTLENGNLTFAPELYLPPTLNATANEFSPTTNSSEARATVSGLAEQLRIIKISLLALIFVLILCGNVFVLLALIVSAYTALFSFFVNF